jgi:hypothetical protein
LSNINNVYSTSARGAQKEQRTCSAQNGATFNGDVMMEAEQGSAGSQVVRKSNF